MSIIWVLESSVFPDSHAPIRDAILKAGHEILDWSDDWTFERPPNRLSKSPVVFHGSLGNAAYIEQHLNWRPGAFCEASRFACSAWYNSTSQWLVHERHVFSTVGEFCDNPEHIAESVNTGGNVFVRPDSPLKPFAGRVIELQGVQPKSLDHGFYYENLDLPIVIAPVRNIGSEWRFVVVNGNLVAASGYDAQTRSAKRIDLGDSVADFARAIASDAYSPSDVYVLDIAECDGELRLMEFNPFGGADLYACDPDAIIDSVSTHALSEYAR